MTNVTILHVLSVGALSNATMNATKKKRIMMSSKKLSDYVLVVQPVGDQTRIQTEFMAFKIKNAMNYLYTANLDVKRDGNALYITEKGKENK